MNTAEKRLGHVPPGFVVNDVPNRRMTNAPFVGQGSLADIPCRISPADVENVLLGKFGLPLSFTARRSFWMCMSAALLAASRSPLSVPIEVIISESSKKQVGGVATGAVIAAMENAEAVWNRAISKSPGNTVGKKHCDRVIRPRTKMELAITAKEFACFPRPTFVGSADADFLSESRDVPWFQRRDAAIYFSHDESPLGSSRITEILPERSVRVN